MGLRTQRSAVQALRNDDPHAPAGRLGAVDVLVSGVSVAGSAASASLTSTPEDRELSVFRKEKSREADD